MEKKVLFTEKEIHAYQKAYEDLENRHKEGNLVDKYDLYYKAKESIDATIKQVSIMRERKRYTDLLDAFTIAVGSRMTKKIEYPIIYIMRDDEKYHSLFAQYNSLGARRALHTLLKALIADTDPASLRKNKGIPHNVSFTGFSKIMLGTGKEFTKEAKAYGTGVFNTDYLWQNDDGSTFRWKTEEVKKMCDMILTSRASKAYVSVTNLYDEVYDLLYNEPDFIEFITKISDDIEVVEQQPNAKKDIPCTAVFAATKNSRDVEQIQKMLKELESRGLGPEPIYSPHVRQTKERIKKEFKEGDVILKSHIVDLKSHLPVLIDMPFLKREHGKEDKPTHAKIVVFAMGSGDFLYGFYHDDGPSMKVPIFNRLEQKDFIVGSSYLGIVDKSIKRQRCDIKFTILPVK